MVSLSLCMIVKDEEDVLERCLVSAKEIADEIIIVDTGSTDSTKKIAKKFTKKVYDFKWCEDFAKARNFAFSKATKEYVMWLDADDVILKDDKNKLKELLKNFDTSIDMVMLNYNVGFDEDGNPNFSYYRERIFKRSNGYKWIGQIHEVIPPSGKIMYSSISITHKKLKSGDPKRNIRIFEKMISEGVKLDARQTYYYGRELYYNARYDEAIEVFNNFLEMKDSWIENKINACLDLYNTYTILNKENEALFSLYRSFEFDKPRAEICCEIGNHLFKHEKYNIAIFWYELASSMEPNKENGGFVLTDYYDYFPYIQLCVCYYNLGDIKKAEYYNEKAGNVKPKDTVYLGNKEFFKKQQLE